jgi:PIN domain nuclease of toxin-antitoxin system
MQLLLDTHVLLALAKEVSLKLDQRIESAVMAVANQSFASVASIWEIAIKARLGKLALVRPIDQLPGFLESIGLTLLIIDHRHAVAAVDPQPPTRDPFDRLLLSQCFVENLRLVTLDKALAGHPLAWRPN